VVAAVDWFSFSCPAPTRGRIIDDDNDDDDDDDDDDEESLWILLLTGIGTNPAVQGISSLKVSQYY
jgi:hypothetical protein